MTKTAKNIFSIVFIAILFIQYFTFINNSNKTITVFSEANSDILDYSNYLIDFKDELSTKNFKNKFSILKNNDYQIKKIYPNINEIWPNNIKEELSEYSFDNLENFITNYIDKLKKYNLSEEISNVDISGIRINRVLIYTSKENIKKLKSQYNNIEYQKK